MDKKQKGHYLHLMYEAMSTDLGIKVQTNDASRLQQELGMARVQFRSEGISEFDVLSFRVFKPEEESTEYVFITKRLDPHQIAELIRSRPVQESPDAEEET